MAINDITMGGSGSGVPAGAYQGTFVGIEDVPPNPEKDYGPGFRWKWEITSGEHAGKIAPRTTGQVIKPTTNAGKLLLALAGRPVKAGENLKLSDFVGKPYTIIVAATENGGTRVETVAPIAG